MSSRLGKKQKHQQQKKPARRQRKLLITLHHLIMSLIKRLLIQINRELINSIRTRQFFSLHLICLDIFIFVWLTDSFCFCFSPLSNGSLNVAVLIKMDMKTTINQQQLLQTIKGSMAEEVLGKFQVDYSSIAIQGADSCQMIDSFLFQFFFNQRLLKKKYVQLLQILMPLQILMRLL